MEEQPEVPSTKGLRYSSFFIGNKNYGGTSTWLKEAGES
tara:strand:+ start:724 stop:840 length:117 start_codon:yes stop_codon:yes gene_type:complete